MPATYVHNTGTGAYPRKTHHRRTQQIRQSGQDGPDAGKDVRPYLLKRFRTRKTKEMRAVTVPMFRKMRSAFLAYLKKNKESMMDIPEVFGMEFLTKLSERFTENLEGECETSVVISDGKPHLRIQCQPYFGTDCHLAIGGLCHIYEPRTKEAATAFVAEFIRNNSMFCRFESTAWVQIANETCSVDADEHETHEAADAVQCLADMTTESEALSLLLDGLKKRDPLNRDELAALLGDTQPEDPKDGKLLDLLRSGLKYVYDNEWKPSDDDYDRSDNIWANVAISPDDFFPITMKEDPIPAGYDIIRDYYDGDCQEIPPSDYYILENDGNLTDMLDSVGFVDFTSKLTQKLNSYYK